MPFWSRKKKQEQPSKADPTTVVIMESQCLGMTVIEETESDEIKQLSIDQWIDIIQNQKLNGFPFERIYFSFLKGLPDFMRMKIWLLLSSENNAKNFNYTSKMDKPRYSYEKIEDITIEVYERLCQNEPLEKQSQQIQKDIKRTFSVQKVKYHYLIPLLRKLLYASSNSGIQYTQGMNYILLNIIIFALESIGVKEHNIDGLMSSYERDIFIIFRETIIRMQQVFGANNIFKVIQQLQEKISETVPEILFRIYKLGLDCYSCFSQMYYSVMSYNDPPEELSKQMLDLFFLTGEKAIHATIIRMLQITEEKIMNIKDTEQMQRFLKVQIYHQYYKYSSKERETAKSISDFGLCFFDSVQRLKM